MTKSDIERLKRAANQLADGLKSMKLGVLHTKTKISAGGGETVHDGWSQDIAKWGDRLMIAVSLDKYTRASKRAFWVGFYSSDSESIKRLYENMLEPAYTLYTRDAESQNGIWLLRQPLPKSLFNCPIAELYEDDEKFFGYYDFSENLDIARAVNFISSVVLAQENGADEESVDAEMIARNPELSETDKTQLILARRGQGGFRQALEAIWDSSCPVTGHTTRELLRASHIMAWRVADNKQRLNPYNGILLAATLDALFDKHLISFDEEGKLMISDLLSADEVRRLQLPQQTSIGLHDEHQSFLKHHRLQFEQKRARGSVV